MQLLAMNQRSLARSAQQRQQPAPVRAHAVRSVRMIGGARRAVVVRAEQAAAPAPAANALGSTMAVGTIALRKAVAQAAYKGSNVFVVGGTGQLSIRIVRDLLSAGFKVTAGVSDLDAATAAFAFFKRYELIDKAAAANLKLVPLQQLEEDEAAVKALPKKAKIVVVDGDVDSKGKTGAKELQFALALAGATSASQIVLVSTQPTAAPASGGGVFGFFAPKPAAAAPGQPITSLGRLEKQLADSGKPYAIVRAYGTDRVEDGAEPGPYIQIGTLGSIASTQLASKAQAASVVAELLKAAGSSNELVFELGASGDEQLSAADALGEIIASNEAAAAEAAAAAAEEAAKNAAPAIGLFGLGTMSIARAKQATEAKEEVKEEEEAPAPVKKTGTGFSFGFGAPKAAKAEEPKEEEEAPPAKVGTLSARRARAPRAEVVVEEVVIEEAPKAGSGFSFFGTGKVAAKKEAPKEEPKEEEEAPAPKTGSGFSFFGTGKVAAKKEAPKEEPKEEEDASAPKKGTGFSFFGTGKVAVKKEEPKEEEEEEAPAPKKGGFFGTGRVAAKKEAPKEEEEEAPAPKKGGFFGTGRVAAKKEAPKEEEEEAPAPKKGTGFSGLFAVPKRAKPEPEEEEPAPKRGTAIRRAAPPPPPPKPEPKTGTSVRGRAAPAPEPVKRSVSPVRAAPAKPEPKRPEPVKKAEPVKKVEAKKPEPPKKAAPPPPPARTASSRSGTSSVSSRSSSSRATESAPTYVPGTRGARLAAEKAARDAAASQKRK